MHLAQFNIGRLSYDLDDPRVAEFVNGVDMLNRIAERSDGFVWKYETGVGGVVEEQVDGDDRVVVNMTVWQSADDLGHFTFNTLHRHFYERRQEWFDVLEQSHFVMWEIPEGHRPTLDEARARLAHLRENGDSDHAFGWAHLNNAGHWQSRRCAEMAAE